MLRNRDHGAAPRRVARTVGFVALPLIGAIGFATAVPAVDMELAVPHIELAVPPKSHAELSRPDVDRASPSHVEPSHPEHDTWTPADIEWSRPDVEQRSPAHFERSHPDVEP